MPNAFLSFILPLGRCRPGEPMANSPISGLPPLNPEQRRIGVSQFEHANQAVASGNYDYAIRLLQMCCKLDPATLGYRQKLRATEKLKYRNNLRGAWLAWLTTWPGKARTKTALKMSDYLGVLVHGERVLARNPWDVGVQMDMAEAADSLGQLDLAVWLLEQARQKSQTLWSLNRALAQLYEKRGNFNQAIALWNLVRKVRPSDKEADRKLKDLAVHETIARGNYEEAVADAEGEEKASASGVEPSSDQAKGKTKEYRVAVSAPQPDGAAAPTDRTGREAAPIRARLQADLTNAGLYLQLAAVYRRHNELELARAVLQEGLGPTGNAFELIAEMTDLEIEPFRQNLALTEERYKAHPDDEELRNPAHPAPQGGQHARAGAAPPEGRALPDGDGPPLRGRRSAAARRPDRRGHSGIAVGPRRPQAALAVADPVGPLFQGPQQLAAGAAQLRGGAAAVAGGGGGAQEGGAVPSGAGLRRGRRPGPRHRPWQ